MKIIKKPLQNSPMLDLLHIWLCLIFVILAFCKSMLFFTLTTVYVHP